MDDGHGPVVGVHGVADRGQVGRVEVGVDHDEGGRALSLQGGRDVRQERGHGGRAHRDGSREVGREGGRGVGEGRKHDRVVAQGTQTRQRGLRGGRRDDDVGDQGEMGAVRLDRAEREQGDDGGAGWGVHPLARAPVAETQRFQLGPRRIAPTVVLH